jgi:hypothetical protein
VILDRSRHIETEHRARSGCLACASSFRSQRLNAGHLARAATILRLSGADLLNRQSQHSTNERIQFKLGKPRFVAGPKRGFQCGWIFAGWEYRGLEEPKCGAALFAFGVALFVTVGTLRYPTIKL